MSDALAALRARHRELAARLAAPTAVAERAALKAELAELYRAIEGQLAELSGLKGDALALIDRWKALPTADGTRSPTPPGVATRARHTPAAAGGLPMPPGPDGSSLVQ